MQKTVLLSAGASLLAQQAADAIAPIQLTSFKLGNHAGESMMSSSTLPVGDVVYEGDETKIKYTPVHDAEVLLKLEVPRAASEMLVGNLIVYANDEVPMFGGINLDSLIGKFQTTETTAGSLMTIRLIINIPGLVERFDFSNISMDTANFGSFPDENALTRWPWQEEADQIFIEEDNRIGRPAFVVQANGVFWGTPFVFDYDTLGENGNGQ